MSKITRLPYQFLRRRILITQPSLVVRLGPNHCHQAWNISPRFFSSDSNESNDKDKDKKVKILRAPDIADLLKSPVNVEEARSLGINLPPNPEVAVVSELETTSTEEIQTESSSNTSSLLDAISLTDLNGDLAHSKIEILQDIERAKDITSNNSSSSLKVSLSESGLDSEVVYSDATIPAWTVTDDPVWVQMFDRFLFEPDPGPCVLLDTDNSALPMLADSNSNNSNSSISRLSDSTSSDSRAEIDVKRPLTPEDILSIENFRYVHIPKSQLRAQVAQRVHRNEPVAVFSSSTTSSRLCEQILREEGYMRLCNVHTYGYLRRLVEVCSERRSNQ